MLRQFTNLQGYTLVASDGDVGTVREFYFESESWMVRYVVIQIPGWMQERRILIMPNVLDEVDAQDGAIAIKSTKQQTRTSPALSPVRGPEPDSDEINRLADNHMKSDCHLLSSNELLARYSLLAQNADIGTVEDFILDDEQWGVRYLVIRTGDWLRDKRVLLAPEWIEKISPECGDIFVNLAPSVIKDAPRYDSDAQISTAFEQRLHDHYQCRGHWQSR
ncbi:MAG TPA: PRC-barrel domain-containing protein [Chthoniobacterales bacterium]|nr:PRC-barrel domain-containing protein [Chthoniobacterales bacterium]